MGMKEYFLKPETAKMFQAGITAGQNFFASSRKAKLMTPGGSLSHMKNTVLPLSIGLGAIGIATSQADKALDNLGTGISNIKDKIGLNRKIERLINLQPTLANFDRDKIVLYYEQMRHFAPDVAKNDLAAAGYIMHALAMHDQGLPIATYETLAKIQRQMTDSGGKGSVGALGSSLLSGSKYRVGEEGVTSDFTPFFS